MTHDLDPLLAQILELHKQYQPGEFGHNHDALFTFLSQELINLAVNASEYGQGILVQSLTNYRDDLRRRVENSISV